VSSLILSTSTRFLMPILLMFSVFLLLRGHNEPGGGFVGGLVAAASFSLYALAESTAAARRLLRIRPHVLIGVGLLLALGSGVPSLLLGADFMTSSWAAVELPGFGEIHLGTPLIFDLGVFLVVLGVSLVDLFSFAEVGSGAEKR